VLKTIAIVATEHSGDLIGAELTRALFRENPNLNLIGLCGPKMRGAGCHEIGNIEELSVMGFVDVLVNYPRLRRLQKRIIKSLLEQGVDAFIGIDGPDFNLPISRQLRKLGVFTAQYVCPQAWAWREWRVKSIRRSIDMMFALFPFEEKFFQERGIETMFVGHPLAESTKHYQLGDDARSSIIPKRSGLVLAIMPGSRPAEIERHLDLFLRAGVELRKTLGQSVKLLIGCSSSDRENLVRSLMGDYDCEIVVGNSHQVLTKADVAIVVSGTIALESMLCKTPVVVAYKTSKINYVILKLLVKTKYISLPNILTDMKLIPELVQGAVQPRYLAGEALNWLIDTQRKNIFLLKADLIQRRLQQDGSKKVAQTLLQRIEA
tara:strand:+ start:3182 stop:4312 length:1131 start_codon:yes stop_codon:yes gene_type:complete